MSDNFQQILLREVAYILEPLTVDDPERIIALFSRMGWSVEQLFGEDPSALLSQISEIRKLVSEIQEFEKNPPRTLKDLANVLATTARAGEAIHHLSTGLGKIDPSIWQDVPVDLLHYLAASYIERRSAIAFHLLVIAGIIRFESPNAVVHDGVYVRISRPMVRLDGRQLLRFVTDPPGAFRGLYPEPLATRVDAAAMAARLWPHVAALLQACNAATLIGTGNDLYELPDQDALQGMLTAQWNAFSDEGSAAGFTAQIASAQDEGPGLYITPFGEVQIDRQIGRWELAFSLTAGLGILALRSKGIRFAFNSPWAPAKVSAGFRVGTVTSQENPLRIGSSEGTRLEVQGFKLSLDADFEADEQSYEVLADVQSAELVISTKDADGFLARVLPEEIRAKFDLSLGWSSKHGLHVGGDAGLETKLAVEKSVFGVIKLHSVDLEVRLEEEGVDTNIGLTAGLTLGPVGVEVERIGITSALRFPPEGGNLTVANWDVQFLPPKGAGVKIDAGVVSGSGYLFFDGQKQEYAGALQLRFATFGVSAIGILTTRMPDGSPGFSLLVIIAADGFAPIQLGLGFTLIGIGGLLGVNRTSSVDVLRSNLKAGVLESILFPSNVAQNAQSVVSSVNSVFPPAQDRFVVGPMLMLGWGTPTIVTIKAALILEIPHPVRLILLARLSALLPNKDKAIVRLQMDAIGVIDFDRGELSLDASLYDSQVLQFVITGDMALRIRWKDEPTFLLSIGGYHPAYIPPPAFPTLGRLSISLTTGKNPRLKFEAYIAITSNSIQFGARAELYVAVWELSIEAYLSFDAFFQFNPFQFSIDIALGVLLRWGSLVLLGIEVALSLSGPSPWRIRGEATLHILFFKISVHFDHRFGASEPPALPDPVDIRALLIEELRDARNWSGELTQTGDVPVSLREAQSQASGENIQLYVDPLATLNVRQKIVPLGQTITKFGNSRPSGEDRFELSFKFANSGRYLNTQPLTEKFARSQFFEMKDHEKLTASAFEDMNAGYRFGSSISQSYESYGLIVLVEPEDFTLNTEATA